MLVAFSVLGGCTAAGAPTPPGAGEARPAASGVDALLAARGAAVVAGDRTGWLRPVDASATAFRRAQSDAWSVLVRLPLASWRETRIGEVTPSLGGGTGPSAPTEAVSGAEWSVRVRLEYQLRGTDPAPVRRDSTLLLRTDSRGESLVGERDASAVAPWDVAPAHVLRTAGTLLVVSSAAGPLRRWADLVGAAARRVRHVLGPPRVRPLVVVPAPGAAGPGLGSVHPLAAVTVGGRIFVSPPAVALLSTAGRVVVLAHELTHATTGASATGVPAWLTEGFADWVGWTGSGIPVAAAAAELFAAVAVSGVPAGLPSDAAFGVGRGGAPAAYESAWLACRLLAALRGPARFVAFYRDAQRRGLSAALAAAYGLTPARLTQLWRADVRRQAHGGHGQRASAREERMLEESEHAAGDGQ